MQAQTIVNNMLNNDPFSLWMGVEIITCQPGQVDLKMKVNSSMTNGFSIAHGGIAYSLADSALAFSSNAYGVHALSIETAISHSLPAYENDILITKVNEITRNKKLARYQILIDNQNKDLIAVFNGTVYFKNKNW